MNILGVAASLLGFFAVALGAFGAHGLEGKLDAKANDWWQTATLYALVHAVAALVMAGQSGVFRTGGWSFVIGTVLFSGSLYFMALGGPRLLGAVTPVGGVAFLLGWGICGWAFLQR